MKKEEGYLDTKDWELFENVFKKLLEEGMEIEEIEKILKSKDLLTNAIISVNSAYSDDIYQYIKQNSKKNCEFFRRENKEFEDRLLRLWNRPFEQYETLIYVSQEIGNEFNNEFRSAAVENDDFVFEVLIHLHGRACQIALEILKLMQGGFPDGAIARWRTLHEIAIICDFIQKCGKDTAERYLLHDAIESYNSIEKYLRKPEIYRKHQKILSGSLPPAVEMKRIANFKNILCKQFGKEYEMGYGWAANVIKNPNFSKIEEFVDMDYLRPHYKMANISIHGGSKGMKFHLTSPNRQLIPAGPGNMGMSEPGKLAAISLLWINTNLLISKPSIRRSSDILALTKLIQEIKRSFDQVAWRSLWQYHQKILITRTRIKFQKRRIRYVLKGRKKRI